MYSTLITLSVIAVIGLVLYAMVKYENARPFLVGGLALAWFFVGVYSSFTAWQYYSTVSKTYGTLEEHDLYEDFNFYEYDILDFALEKNDDGNYFYTKTYATSIEFDGTDKSYTLLINNKPCDKTSSNYGKLYGHTVLHFDDVDGSYKCGIEVDVTFTFYSSSIKLDIYTTATDDNAGLLVEYFKINGFNLRILNEVYSYYPLLSEGAE
jgi:hypothetical protein